MFLQDRTQDVGSQLEKDRGAAVSFSRPCPWGRMASICPSVMTAADTQPAWYPVSPLHRYLVWKWKRVLQGVTWCFSSKCPPIFVIHWWFLHDPNFILIFEKMLTFQVCRSLHIFLLAHDILLQRRASPSSYLVCWLTCLPIYYSCALVSLVLKVISGLK